MNRRLQDAGADEKSIYDFKMLESSTWEAAWLKQLRGITADQTMVVRTAVATTIVDVLLGSVWLGTELRRQDAAADGTYIFKISKYISYIWTGDDTMWSPRELTHAINTESPSYVGIFILIIQ